MQPLIEQLGNIERDDHLELTLSDGTVLSGRVSPIEFTPEEWLRFEIRSDDRDVRLEVTATYENDQWTPVRVEQLTNEEEWVPLGEVTSVEVGPQEGQTDHEKYQSDVRL